VAPFSETHLKPHEKSFIPNFHFYRTNRYPSRKGGTADEVRKGIPHNHVNLPPFVSLEGIGVCKPIGNSEVLLAVVYKSPGRAWSDTDITELLRFRPKYILAGDLKGRNPFWNRTISNPSGDKLLHLFDVNQFEISAPQCSTHYSPNGHGNVWILWFTKTSECQMLLFLIFWSHITYQ
jgi:hypothetical protein